MLRAKSDRISLIGAVIVVSAAVGCSGSNGSSDSPNGSPSNQDSSAADIANNEALGTDASVTPLCDPNNPLSVVSVGPIADPAKFAVPANVKNAPTACPGYACTYQDVEISYRTCAGTIAGARARYVRPLAANVRDKTHVPALLSVPGTGDCSVGDPQPTGLEMLTAQAGAAVFAVAPRGHTSCYFPGDALYNLSDWIGPKTLGDYDRLLLAFTRGWLDPSYKGDVARLGMTGGSNGGITSYVFGRESHVPGITHQPFALVMPDEGNPDTGSWVAPGIDPSDVNPLLEGTIKSAPWGAMRLSGEPAQQDVYPGPDFNDPLRADVLADANIASWIAKDEWRSAHDDAQAIDTKTFQKQVKYFLGEMGSQDCIIPHAGTFQFYDQLSKAGMSAARFLSPLDYHSCGEGNEIATTTGYLPKFTPANRAAISTWMNAVRGGWIYRYLVGSVPPATFIDPGATDPTSQPDWMFMLADEGNGSTIPNVYTAAHPGELAVTPLTVSLGATLDQKTLAYDPMGMGTSLDLKHPTWNEAARAEIDLDFPVTVDTVVIGQADLVVFVNEINGQPFTFTAILEDVTPASGSSAQVVWPVGSERRYAHTSTAKISRQEILVDTTVHRFRAGHTMRLAISNLSLMVPTGPNGDSPMHAPARDKYSIVFHASSSGESSRVTLPTIAGSALVKAPSAWQIPN